MPAYCPRGLARQRREASAPCAGTVAQSLRPARRAGGVGARCALAGIAKLRPGFAWTGADSPSSRPLDIEYGFVLQRWERRGVFHGSDHGGYVERTEALSWPEICRRAKLAAGRNGRCRCHCNARLPARRQVLVQGDELALDADVAAGGEVLEHAADHFAGGTDAVGDLLLGQPLRNHLHTVPVRGETQ